MLLVRLFVDFGRESSLGLVEMVPQPFQAILVSAALDRVSSDPGGYNLPVVEIPISWFLDLAFYSIPTSSPTKGSMGLILSSNACGYFLPVFKIPKSWVPDPVCSRVHSVGCGGGLAGTGVRLVHALMASAEEVQ